MAPYIKLGGVLFEALIPPYEQGPIRPPSEAESLLIRVNRNCPWNRCEFCETYKGGQFSQRTLQEIISDIDKAERYHREIGDKDRYKTAFLQDGNALAMKTGELVEAISYLKERFPLITRLTAYSSSRIVSRKSQEDLDALGKAGLSRIHIGLESGYGPLLEYMEKGTTPEKHIDAGKKVKQAGISLCEYVLFGLGGQDLTREHALATAEVIAQIAPDFIRSRRLVLKPGMPLYQRVLSGEFKQLNDLGVVLEQRLFIKNLDGISSAFISDHTYNVLMELEGKFPEDKQKMLAVIGRFLALSEEDQRIFIFGRRYGAFGKLDHLHSDERVYNGIKDALREFKSKHHDEDNKLFDQEIFKMLVNMGS